MISAQLRNVQNYRRPRRSGGTTGTATAFNWRPAARTGSSPGVGGSGYRPPGTSGPVGGGGSGQAPLDPLRPDSIYETALSNIRNSLTGTEAALNKDEDALAVDYGVSFGRDGQGQATGFKLDYTNPFSKASLLQKAFETQGRANTNSYAARGQLYAGSLQNAQNDTVTQNQQGQNELLSGFGGLAREIFARRLAARNQAGGDTTSALEALRDRNIAAGPQPAALPAPGAPAAGGGSSPAASPQNALGALIQRYGGQNVKWTNRGLFYKRPSDGMWIPVRL